VKYALLTYSPAETLVIRSLKMSEGLRGYELIMNRNEAAVRKREKMSPISHGRARKNVILASAEGPMSHDQPTYASVPGIRVYGMMCVQGSRRGRPLRNIRSILGEREREYVCPCHGVLVCACA
jgi:hypothetical protein